MEKYYKCGKDGHFARECYQNSRGSRDRTSNSACYKCGQTGHQKRDCPQSFKSKTNRSSVSTAVSAAVSAASSSSHADPDRVFQSQVRCYDCDEMVWDLDQHRVLCRTPFSKRKGRGKSTRNQIQPTDAKLDDYIDTMDFYFLQDVSSSMAGKRESDAKETMMGLFDMMSGSDRISIVTFDTKAFFKLKPRPVEQIRRQDEMPGILARIFSRGMTAIWDAIYLTVQQIERKDRKTQILCLTDGYDNSSKHSYEETLALVAEYPNITLSIVHIDGSGNRIVQYEEICKGRGEYLVIDDTQIKKEVTRIFRLYYVTPVEVKATIDARGNASVTTTLLPTVAID
jgi:Zinc knuckle/von Willebrand factor type A domain